MYNVYKYRWDIYSVYDRAIEFDYDDKYNKYNKNDETKALNNEHIHR